MNKSKANENIEDEELLTYSPKQVRNTLSVAQKLEIIYYSDDHPNFSHVQLATYE